MAYYIQAFVKEKGARYEKRERKSEVIEDLDDALRRLRSLAAELDPKTAYQVWLVNLDEDGNPTGNIYDETYQVPDHVTPKRGAKKVWVPRVFTSTAVRDALARIEINGEFTVHAFSVEPDGTENELFVSDVIEDIEEAAILMFEVQAKMFPGTAGSVHIREGGKNGELIYVETYSRVAKDWQHNPIFPADPRVLAAINRMMALEN